MLSNMNISKVKRIVHGTAMVLALSILGLIFYYSFWLLTDEEFRQELFEHGPLHSWNVLVDYISCCLFTSIVTLYYWRSRERTEKERDRFRLQALENQLSPHFVFNNFSILADLIEVDPKKASTYLMNLSKVYRYTLTHLDHVTVSLHEELEFLQRYISLLQQRFGSGIDIRIAPEITNMQGELPPAALQMLIENAIKHNEHTTARPLIIDVSTDGQYIVVSNRKQLIATDNSANIGQHNITERYRLLTHQKVVINDAEDIYSVSIPLINK